MKASVREHNTLWSKQSSNSRAKSIASIEQTILKLDHKIENLTQRLTGNPNMDYHQAYAHQLKNLRKQRADLVKGKFQSKLAVKTSYKKPKEDVAHKIIMNHINELKMNGQKSVTLEEMVNATSIHQNIVKKLFIRLNREGILSQAINHRHEDFDWVASYYLFK